MKNRLSLVLVAVSLAACSGSKSSQRGDASDRVVPEYFPLHKGDRWTYDAVSGPRKETETYEVVGQPDERTFVLEVKTSGDRKDKPRSGKAKMELRPRGLFDGTRYILQEPLSAGQKWTVVLDARTAEKFEVLTTTAESTVPAGRFTGCTTVRVGITEPGGVLQATDSTYCRGVGMVESVTHITKPGRPQLELGHLRLTKMETGGQRVYPKYLGE